MPLLVIVRHGQSAWNLENRFTGDVDVDLTPQGEEEARSAGRKLTGIPFSHCFTSILKRAEETLSLIMQEAGQPNLPISRDKALNERSYGQLQGLNKAAIAQQYGDEQVAIWRRSYSIKPPGGESLQDTAARVIPYYNTMIEPLLKKGENILIVAHGNSLRALMMHLENLSEDEIADVNIPTGVPKEYKMDDQLQIVSCRYL